MSERRPLESLPLPQQAAILCGDPVFQKYMGCEDEKSATDRLRLICRVSSRRELRPDNNAGRKFIRKREQFRAWKIVA